MRIIKNDEKTIIKISVRELVEFTERSGSIDTGRSGKRDAEAMQKGAAIHRAVQAAQGSNYKKEVPLSFVFRYDTNDIETEGRADGIIYGDKGITIDEIKTLAGDIRDIGEPERVHLAQAIFYAYMILADNDDESINIRITYVHRESLKTKYFDKAYSRQEIEDEVRKMTDSFEELGKILCDNLKNRDDSIGKLSFPFPYRKGQENIVKAVYGTIREKKRLFLEAPTGLGKTMAVLYPAIHSLGEGLSDRIFYLTARSVAGNAASDACTILKDRGLDLKCISIMSKEKTCFLREPQCDPESCMYAEGFYDRINDAVKELLSSDMVLTKEAVKDQAERYRICPYYLAMELAAYCDLIICDYNYVFDPDSRLAGLFENGENCPVILVDEAHNMVDRGREMYSAVIEKEEVLKTKRALKDVDKKAVNALEKLNKALLKVKKETERSPVIPLSDELSDAVRKCVFTFESILADDNKQIDTDAFIDLYFSLRSFEAASERADERYVLYGRSEGRNLILRYFCTDPSKDIMEISQGCAGIVYFSATLTPIEYYMRLIGRDDTDYTYNAPSPFSDENRVILVGTDTTTKYTRRNKGEYRLICTYIKKTALSRKGNYLAFFPSHKMLNDVFSIFKSEFDCDDINWAVQSRIMNEEDREIFLENFEDDPPRSFIGFTVMGGLFSEGIDLTGEKLIGVIVVGTGLPQISEETEILKNRYTENGMNGFDYAFKYPGMNKVMQAAGRLIRTESDRGMILLLDERFKRPDYNRLFRGDWEKRTYITVDGLEESIKDFWDDETEKKRHS